MLQLENKSGLQAAIVAGLDSRGCDCVSVAAKVTFDVASAVSLASKQLEVAPKDAYCRDEAESSVRTPTDLSQEKLGTDVVVIGRALAPANRPVTELDVALSIGSVRKVVRVFGDRVWKNGMFSAKPSPPQPFVKMPLMWERAFGGSDGNRKTGQMEFEARNPVGRGFRSSHSEKPLDGLSLPNLERPDQLIRSWKDRPAPAGFGPIAPAWEPRKTRAGTYDEAWQKSRAPILPTDFDPLFFQMAPDDQVISPTLKGGEDVHITNVRPEGDLRFRLPAYDVLMTYHFDGAVIPKLGILDTIIIEPDDNRLVMVWRSHLPCDKMTLRVERVRIDAEPRKA